MAESYRTRASNIEREVEAGIRNIVMTKDGRSRVGHPTIESPSIASAPLPDYVSHSAGATDIGKLSAEAIVREYEAAAKDIEAMGAELIERVKQCEAMTQAAVQVSDELKETARRYREEAKQIFLQIENCSLMTAEVRKTCTELKGRIADPATHHAKFGQRKSTELLEAVVPLAIGAQSPDA